MPDNDDIPVLTDLIEERIDITTPELGFNTGGDLIIDQGEEPEFSFNSDELEAVVSSKADTRSARRKELEQSIRYILDEHLELAWTEIRQTIEVAFDDEDNNS